MFCMLIAEDLLLLLTDDSSGKHLVDGNTLDLGLAGGVLVELVLSGAVAITGPGEQVRPGRVVVRSETPVDDPLLDEAVQRTLATGPRKPQDLLPKLARGLRPTLLSRLTDRGILRAEEDRVLWIFPTRSWPAADSSHEWQVRAALYEVLVTGRPARDREAALVSLLHATGSVAKVVAGAPAWEIKQRAKALAEGELAGKAVREAIQAVNTAVMVAVVAVSAGAAGTN